MSSMIVGENMSLDVAEFYRESLSVHCGFDQLQSVISKYIKDGWNFISMHPTWVVGMPSRVIVFFSKDK